MKRYFTKELDHNDKKLFLELEENDIDKAVEMAGLVYCSDINDINTYNYETAGYTRSLTLSEVQGLTYADVDLFEIDTLSGLDCGFADDEDTEYLKSNMIATMKQKGKSGEELESFEEYEYWDGSNWKTISLNYYDEDTGWEEETEIFQEMLLIDTDRYDFRIDRHYKLKDGRKATETQSFYQGSLPLIYIED